MVLQSIQTDMVFSENNFEIRTICLLVANLVNLHYQCVHRSKLYDIKIISCDRSSDSLVHEYKANINLVMLMRSLYGAFLPLLTGSRVWLIHPTYILVVPGAHQGAQSQSAEWRPRDCGLFGN